MFRLCIANISDKNNINNLTLLTYEFVTICVYNSIVLSHGSVGLAAQCSVAVIPPLDNAACTQ